MVLGPEKSVLDFLEYAKLYKTFHGIPHCFAKVAHSQILLQIIVDFLAQGHYSLTLQLV